MPRYVRIPVYVDAFACEEAISIPTENGAVEVAAGDYIVKDSNGTQLALRKDIFEANYERVPDDAYAEIMQNLGKNIDLAKAILPEEREASLVVTKMEEGQMWASKGFVDHMLREEQKISDQNRSED